MKEVVLSSLPPKPQQRCKNRSGHLLCRTGETLSKMAHVSSHYLPFLYPIPTNLWRKVYKLHMDLSALPRERQATTMPDSSKGLPNQVWLYHDHENLQPVGPGDAQLGLGS